MYRVNNTMVLVHSFAGSLQLVDLKTFEMHVHTPVFLKRTRMIRMLVKQEL